MDVILRQRVVIIVHVRADAVQQRDEQRIEALPAAEYARRCCPGVGAQRRDGHNHRRVLRPAQRAADNVDNRSLRLVAHVLWDAIETAVANVFHHFGGVCHGPEPLSMDRHGPPTEVPLGKIVCQSGTGSAAATA